MVWPNSYFDHRGESINLQLFFVLRRWGVCVCVFEFITCSMLPTILVMACEFNKKQNKNKKQKPAIIEKKKEYILD